MDNSNKAQERGRLVRWTMMGLGLVSMVVGGIGVVVPGLPTTVFLILASYFFSRSCPPLDAWMRSNRMFRPYVRYLDRDEPMPLHAVGWTLVFIWSGVGFSTYRLWSAMDPLVLVLGAASLGSIASFSLVWWGRMSIVRAHATADQGSSRVEAVHSATM